MNCRTTKKGTFWGFPRAKQMQLKVHYNAGVFYPHMIRDKGFDLCWSREELLRFEVSSFREKSRGEPGMETSVNFVKVDISYYKFDKILELFIFQVKIRFWRERDPDIVLAGAGSRLGGSRPRNWYDDLRWLGSGLRLTGSGSDPLEKKN